MKGIKGIKYSIGLVIVLMTSPFFMFGQAKQTANADLEIKADTLLDRQDFEGALKLYSNVVKKSKFKTDEEFNILYKRAYCLYALKRFDEALIDLNQYLEKIPNQQARILRLYVNQELGDTEAQLTDLNALLAERPDSDELLRWRLSILMDSDQYKEAQGDIRKMLSHQDDPDLKGYLGLTYYYLENPDSAIIIFDQVIEQNPSHIQTYLYAGSICLEEGAYDAALHYINKGIKLDPTNATLLFYKGAALVEKEDLIEGCRCLNKAFASGIDDAAGYLEEYCYGEAN
jgi:tetratricopeptide (TPR) repeat protein